MVSKPLSSTTTPPSATGGDGSADAGASKCAPGLHVVATPIGNLADLSGRARSVLAAADIVACEDTRRTGRLLKAWGIEARLAAYHDHNAPRALPRLLATLERGGAVALVSDAGSPLISDPGYRLVGAAIDAGIAVTAVPGPSSVVAALTVSGLPCDRFVFAGFLPPRGGARRAALASLAALDMTVILFESARRLATTLGDLAAAFGDRPLAIARELTKRHEEVRRGRLAALAAEVAALPRPKGEIVLVVGPPPARDPADIDWADVDERLAGALADMTARDAARQVSADTGVPRRVLYARAVALRDGGASPGGAAER